MTEIFGMSVAEFLVFLEQQVLPWVSALLLAGVYSIPMVTKYTKFASGIKASFESLKLENGVSIETAKTVLEEVKREAKAVYEEFKSDVDKMPIAEIKELLRVSLDESKNVYSTIKGFQECFVLMFDFLYKQAEGSPIISQDEKEKMKVLHKTALDKLSKADLSEGFKRIKLASDKIDCEEVKENAENEIEKSGG